MATSSKDVRIIKPSIDDFNDTVVVRGVIDNDSLQHLRVDHYQRELLPSRSRRNIRTAITNGERLPDITLGVRGDQFDVVGDALVLKDPVYIIDGQQRCGTILEMCWEGLPAVRLGATVHLNTTVDWERELFHKLNLYQAKMSPNVLLRNIKEDHHALTMLYGLTRNDKKFVMHNRVSWQQNMAKGEVMSALSMLLSSLYLHSHICGHPHRSVSRLVPMSDSLIGKVGMMVYRDNVRTYYNLIDECWGIGRATLRGGAPYLRGAFQIVLARILSDHFDFWKQPDEKRLVIEPSLRRKLAKFPLNDPEIYRLTSATGAAIQTLYFHLITHLNSGKRTKHLRSRKATVTIETSDTEEDLEAEAG